MAVNQGVVPVDYSTPVGQFRALIGDTDAVALVPPAAGQGSYVWFGDDEIGAFLSLYSDNPKRAAARALLTIAGSQALLLKKWSSDDLSVDGAAIAEALRKQAKDLQDEANNDAANVDIFGISHFPSNDGIIPELTAARWGRGLDGEWHLVPYGDPWTVDDDGYIVG